uniref:Perivitellin-2 31 kDa subunit n=1 Tax=Littorina littorea TaxID=31216 RepID=A0A165X563_LITLI|nr:perivitellin-2 31 kDa subunit [Littorina littorea]
MVRLPVRVTICISVLFLASLEPCACHTAICSSTTSWQQSSGALVKLSVGPGGMWGVNIHNLTWYRDGTFGTPGHFGSGWTQVDGSLKDLDVGDDVVWGITLEGNLACRKGIHEATPTGESWSTLNTKARDVAISPKGHLVGITQRGQMFFRAGLSSKCSKMGEWFTSTGSSLTLTQISIGEAGIWAVDVADKIYYRPGSMGDKGNIGTEWKQVSGSLVTLGVGKDFVIGVNKNDDIWRRDGVTKCTPGGTNWVKLTGALKVVDAYNGCYAWGVNSGQNIWLGTF